MKLTKTAAAMALAGIAAAPMAQAEVTLTGYIGIILGANDKDDTIVTDDAGAPTGEIIENDRWAFSADDANINVAATHELDNGLTGYGNWRADLGLANDGVGQADNIHIGVKGDFGDLRVGEVPDALEYGQVAGDMYDIGGEERGISYTGTFGSATVGLNWSPVGTMNGDKAGGGSDKIAAGVKFNAGGFGIGLGFGDVNEETRISVGATYKIGGASIGLAFKDFDNDAQTVGAKIGWGIGKTSLALTYEGQQGDASDDSKIRFDAGYDLGGDLNISTRVNLLDSATDVTDYRVMLAKSF